MGPVGEQELTRLCEGYTRITGDRVGTPGKRKLVAACYRVHGDDFLQLVAQQFAASGTATNLLGVLRTSPLRDLASSAHPDEDSPGVVVTATDTAADDRRTRDDEPNEDSAFEDWLGASVLLQELDADWWPEPSIRAPARPDDLVPGLLYGETDRPRLTSGDRRRWDDRASNPDREAILAGRSRVVAELHGWAR
jgi:hypothetical protein